MSIFTYIDILVLEDLGKFINDLSVAIKTVIQLYLIVKTFFSASSRVAEGLVDLVGDGPRRGGAREPIG